MMKLRNWLLGFVLCFCAVIGLALESEAQKVRVSMPAVSTSGLPQFIARDKGYFHEEGLEDQLLIMAAPTANLTLIAGEVDFSTLPVAGIVAISRGAPLVVLYTAYQRPEHVLITKPEIRRIEDLKGKRVMVVRPKFLDDLLLQAALNKRGLSVPKDVTVLGGGLPQNRLAALMAGSADAAVLSPPFSFRAEEAGFRALFAFKDEDQGFTAGGVVARLEVLRSKPEMVRKFMRATLKGHIYVRDNREGSIEGVAKILQTDNVETARKIYDFSRPSLTSDGTMTQQNMREAVDFIVRFAGVKGSPPVEKFFDNSLVLEVMKELQAEGWKPGR